MIKITDETHRQMIDKGYTVEQAIPERVFEKMVAEMDLSSEAYEQVRLIHSSYAFNKNRFTPSEKSVIVYVKHSQREAREREGLVNEIWVGMKDRRTGKKSFSRFG